MGPTADTDSVMNSTSAVRRGVTEQMLVLLVEEGHEARAASSSSCPATSSAGISTGTSWACPR